MTGNLTITSNILRGRKKDNFWRRQVLSPAPLCNLSVTQASVSLESICQPESPHLTLPHLTSPLLASPQERLFSINRYQSLIQSIQSQIAKLVSELTFYYGQFTMLRKFTKVQKLTIVNCHSIFGLWVIINVWRVLQDSKLQGFPHISSTFYFLSSFT